ncbi:MAG: thymidine phosphorylase [Spirochaeta sp. LUC14_002_19_P3]|nr:MAG: thymidine phosphorylase [Spirochaeta sp. LUC14_002_19_P3]
MSAPLRAVEIIAAKRDGKVLSREQIAAFVSGYANGSIPDYQAAAWCMAVFLKGMTPEETGHLTQAMIDSGDVIDLSSVSGPLADKHSTGGVGDKISLVLAPIAAACGVNVPMMSGRALGHTGGTLDKLESMPGFSTSLSPEGFAEAVNKVGYGLIGQSEKIVPADRKLYALRDVIATVESIPLITGSILSKKFAEGADALVMDVKCGVGAFMKTREAARELALSLVGAGKSLGRRVIAVITDMSEPLGRMVGNFLEVEESIACLEGRGPDDVMAITYRLTAWMLIAAGLENDIFQAEERCRRAVSDGSALKKFRENAAFQGCNLSDLDAMIGRTRGRCSRDIPAPQGGIVNSINAFSAGMAAVALGVGRDKADDKVQPLAGIELLKKSGDAVAAGEALMRLWSEEEWRLDAAVQRLTGAVIIKQTAPELRRSLILEEISD